jgi:hypothetical protein
VVPPLSIEEEDVRRIVDDLTLIKVSSAKNSEASKELSAKRREYEGMLKPYFDKSESGVIATGHPTYDIKRIVIPPSTSYDVRAAMARGYLSQEDAEKVKRVSPGYSYTVLVKKKGISND